MRMGLLSLAVLIGASVSSSAEAGPAEVGGYFRLGTRPDFQGGDGRLGHGNLYGRLLNEGPYALLELRYDVLERQPDRAEPWTALHMRIEGGSIQGADMQGGSLGVFRMSQVYAEAGDLWRPDLSVRVGTLETWLGDLGLYDMRPAQLFSGTIGMSTTWQPGLLEFTLGVGDAGYSLDPAATNSVLVAGGIARMLPSRHLDLAIGGEVRHEPKVMGNRNAPHETPGLDYEDWLRGEVLEVWRGENTTAVDFPDPIPTAADSNKLIGGLGFGGFGPLNWWSTYLSLERLHPTGTSTETFEDEEITLYTTALTDERTVFLVGSEVIVRLWPERLDLAAGALHGNHEDADNDIAPSDHDRLYSSAVLRLQAYPTRTVHWLVESSIAREWSRNGRTWREHADSIFDNTAGIPDTRGFEEGDTDTRITWQGKTGLVFNPLGPGVFTRPSLRVLYGVQHSNENNAFGNSFVETLDQYNEFGNTERHWHHVIALETEAWF